MVTTFREKSLWLTLAGLLITVCGYLYSSYLMNLNVPTTGDLTPGHAALFLALTAVLVVFLVVGHSATAIIDRHTEPDERDRWIEARGSRYSSVLLAVGVFAALCAAAMTEGNAIMAHVLLGFWVLAEGAGVVYQLVMYRRGA